MKIHTTTTFSALSLLISSASAFAPILSVPSQMIPRSPSLRLEATPSSRRDFGMGVVASIAATQSVLFAPPAVAEESTGVLAPPVDMKLFVDPQGLFSIIVPAKFYKIRRSDKGDLPDEKTGKGRRGSSIFTAGDLSKAEIIAVERYVPIVICFRGSSEMVGLWLCSLCVFMELCLTMETILLLHLGSQHEYCWKKTGKVYWNLYYLLAL